MVNALRYCVMTLSACHRSRPRGELGKGNSFWGNCPQGKNSSRMNPGPQKVKGIV
jgi:hypothetical protein